MDHNETPVETSSDYNFAKLIVQDLALSAAITVGCCAGFLAFGMAYAKTKDLIAARKAAKIIEN